MAGVIRDLRTFSVAANASLKTALQSREKTDVSAQFTTVINMNTKRIEFPMAGSTGPMREWKGSRIVTSIMRDSYSIVAKKFEKTVSLPVEDEEDDNLDVYMPAIRTIATQIAAWRSQQVHAALEANGPGYDDQPFFSNTHPERGLNASNYQAGAGPAWYLFDTTKDVQAVIWGEYVSPKLVPKTSPDDDNVFWRDEYVWGARARGGAGYGLWQSAFKSKAALDAANYESAVTQMRARRDEHGDTLDITPVLLVVPGELQWDAQRLFGRSTDENGGDNIHEGGIRFVVDNRLTGA